MSRLLAVARFALAEFGPLIVFWTLAATLGVKPAILGSILFIVADAAWRWRKRLTFTRLYLLTSGSHPCLRPRRSRLDLAVHAQIRSGDHQRGDRPCLRRRGAGGEADHPGGRRAARRDLRRHRRGSRLLSPVHACLGGLFLPQGGASTLWAVWTLPMLEAMALRSVAGGVSLGLHDRGQRDARAAPVLSLPPPRPAAQARRAAARRRRPAREPSMTIRSDEAAAMLADVESVVAKVKQSRIYRSAALIIILWGVVNLVRDALIALAPAVVRLAMVLRRRGRRRRHDRHSAPRRGRRRALSAADACRVSLCSMPSAGSGRTCSGDFGPREQMAFWPTLFLFGYALAGLWFGCGVHGDWPRPHRA